MSCDAHLYNLFLCYVRDLFLDANKNDDSKTLEANPIWIYLVSCFEEHQYGIIWLMRAGYVPDYCFLKETLSGKYPVIYLHEGEKFTESMVWPSDLVPSVSFCLPNNFWKELLSQSRLLRVEFQKSGVIWADARY